MAAEHGADIRIAPGATLAGKYKLVREIGRGGVGVVYEAEHLRLRQRVAIKILLKAVVDQFHVSARFEREARAMASLRSPYVTAVSDVDVLEDGSPYMVMELLEGRDLQAEIRERGMLPVSEVVQIGLLACRGLAAVHTAGIIHRDLKPSNLFLVRNGSELNVKVMDFGVSKMEGDDVLVTHDGSTLGTPAYMSPEQVRSARDADARADIWSLGVILFRALAAVLPFEGQGITGMAVAITNEPPKDLAALRPEIPPGLVAIVLRMLEKNPANRYASIGDVALALSAFGDAPFTEAETDPNVSLPELAAKHDETTPGFDPDGDAAHVSHVRSSDSRSDLAPSSVSSSSSISSSPSSTSAAALSAPFELSSPPPRSRMLLLVLPAGVLTVVAGAAVFIALRVKPEPPTIPPAATLPTASAAVASGVAVPTGGVEGEPTGTTIATATSAAATATATATATASSPASAATASTTPTTSSTSNGRASAPLPGRSTEAAAVDGGAHRVKKPEAKPAGSVLPSHL